MAADVDGIEILSSSQRLSSHSELADWGAAERYRMAHRKIAGVGREAARAELRRRKQKKSVIATFVVGFAATVLVLCVVAVAGAELCARALDADPYSVITRACDRTPFSVR